MNTQDMQGSFITLIWTLIAMVQDITNAERVPLPPHADMVADLLLQPIISRTMQRQLVEEARLNPRVYRYNSADNATPPCWSGSRSKLSPR